MATQWFISDLHLAIERPDTLTLFEYFLEHHPRSGDRLYILGDLFDVWIGDDDDAELAERVRRALRRASQRGVELLIQRGNRDFLIGRRLMQDCGAKLLPDCVVSEVAGQPTLLMHGDLLCTDDVDYQRARRRFRNPLFQWFMLRKSLQQRRRISADYRRRSGEATALKPSEIMDVNPDTVLRYLERYRVRQLVHGHTHRPATHRHRLPDGSEATRLVLPEWLGDTTTVWRDDGRRLEPATVERD
jgi:UDP-2,3-diacylglucosamine hydrolase